MVTRQGEQSYQWECNESQLNWIRQLIEKSYSLEKSSNDENSLHVYDSFPFQLLKNGILLTKEKSRFHLVGNLPQMDVIEPTLFRGHKPAFWWHFENEVIRNTLRSILHYRAATPRHSLKLMINCERVINGDGKTILRWTTHQYVLEDSTRIIITKFEPLLGYQHELRGILKSISAYLGEQSSSIIGRLFQSIQPQPPILFPKNGIHLESTQTVSESVINIAHFMIRAARQYETGMVQDIDTEYLHDFRVSIRKLRSLIALVKGAFSKEDTKEMKKYFGDIARSTNKLRDLDVWLLDQHKTKQMVPEPLRHGLDKLFSDFQKDRNKALSDVKKIIQSNDYKENMENWIRRLEENGLKKGKKADQKIGSVVYQEILKHFGLVQKLGKRISDLSPDDEVHELRIECKKLRYLLELFSSLFSRETLEIITKKLRRLQNVLGEFNDTSIQIHSMNNYLQQNVDNQTASAVGGLITVLHQRHQSAREMVTKRFQEFAHPNVQSKLDFLAKYPMEASES